ncbi:MAG: biopolymer transporter ExbD, partial [Bdellovibrionaceae bacterium]|nr:biopolymer transporter ExbD [Pseudobdellovibrionaceae bacterium]
AEGSIYVDGSLISEEELIDLVKVKLAQNSELMALISADKASQHGVVVRIMDKIKSVGVKKFGINIDNSR